MAGVPPKEAVAVLRVAAAPRFRPPPFRRRSSRASRPPSGRNKRAGIGSASSPRDPPSSRRGTPGQTGARPVSGTGYGVGCSERANNPRSVPLRGSGAVPAAALGAPRVRGHVPLGLPALLRSHHGRRWEETGRHGGDPRSRCSPGKHTRSTMPTLTRAGRCRFGRRLVV